MSNVRRELGGKAGVILRELQDPELSYAEVARRCDSTKRSVRAWASILRSEGYKVPRRCGVGTPEHARVRREARKALDEAGHTEIQPPPPQPGLELIREETTPGLGTLREWRRRPIISKKDVPAVLFFPRGPVERRKTLKELFPGVEVVDPNFDIGGED